MPDQVEKDRPAPKMTVVDRGVEDGIEWVTCEAPLWGAINGYVKAPSGHPWHGLDYDAARVDVTVNGGLTYASGDWFGFDTLHAGDLWPDGDGSHYCPPGSCDCTIWTAELVAEETRRLARQFADAAENAIPDDPPGIDPATHDMPPIEEAAERVNEFIRWFGDGRVFVDPDETSAPPLYARDMEALTRLVTRPGRPDTTTGGA